MSGKAQDDDLVMTLVDRALAKPAPERESFLREACSGDAELFRQAWSYVQWEQRMEGFLLEPLYSPLPVTQAVEHPFQQDDVLDGRFRIESEIAQGGMGVVYVAWDQKLERRIAIKCAKTGFGKRLPPEVRHAQEISHPNVCKIFEIHTAKTAAGELDFVTMEYLEGETLADRLKRGAVPESEARTIARQLCSGLAEAHSQGVVHGDLKSNNVILTKVADASTRAVITDFGMSRATEAGPTVQSGLRGGTPDYMAPELLKGDKASVASDVYALGVMLHELVTGRKPRAGATLEAPAKWNPILQKCLAANPADRYARVAQIAQALEPRRTGRWILMAAAAVLVAAVTGVVTYQRATAPQEVVRLAMLPFTYSADLAPVAEGVLREASANLAKIQGGTKARYSAVSLEDAQRAQADTPEKASTALGATHVLHGTLTPERDHVVLHAVLTDTRTGVNTKDWKMEYAPGQVRYIPVALAGIATGALHLPPLGILSTVNAAAKSDYLAGLAATRSDAQVDKALEFLQRAVTADPDSPLTYAGLAEAQWWKSSVSSGVKNQLWLDQATESVRQAELRNPDLAEVHRISGLLKHNEGYYELAEADYLRAIELDPRSGDVYRRLGQTYERNRQIDQALEAYRKAVEVEPTFYRNVHALALFYYERTNYEEAAKVSRQAVALAPSEPKVHFGLANALEVLGRFGEAESEYRQSLRLGVMPVVLHALGVNLMYQGRDQEALEPLTGALKIAPDDYEVWMNLGTCYRRLKRAAQSEEAYRRAQELGDKLVARNPRIGRIRSHLAFVYARLGDTQRAASEVAQALRLSGDEAETLFMAAQAYEAMNQRQKALDVLSASPPQAIADISRWPDIAGLRQDPGFLQLLASHPIR